MPEQLPHSPELRTGGRRPRRRFFTGDARRPFRVCRHPLPASWVGDVAYCRCGAPLTATTASLSGWRHQPARRRELVAPHVHAAVVHNGRAPELTLSEVVPPAARAEGLTSPHVPPLPVWAESAAAVSLALADHMSPRAAEAFAQVDRSGVRAMRAAWIMDALAKAARCPLCRPTLAPELVAGPFPPAVRRG